MDTEFYHSDKWKRLRRSILKRDGYQCQHARRYGRMEEGNTVHHIFPKDSYPQYATEPWNLITLSKKAHDMMHNRNGNELSQTGIELLIRTARKYGKQIPKQYME